MCVSGKSKVRGDEPVAQDKADRYYIYNFTMRFQSGKHAACFPVFNHRGFYCPPDKLL